MAIRRYTPAVLTAALGLALVLPTRGSARMLDDAPPRSGSPARGSAAAQPAQPAADSAAIRAAALDYIEGWYTGDTTRMQRAVHPDLAKRIVMRRPGVPTRLSPSTTAATLVAQTRDGGGRDTPEGERRRDVRILDLFGNAASVRVDARDWVDYLHLGKVDGRWVIVNVLWERRPRG